MVDKSFNITKTIKGNHPRLPFMRIKNKVLGEKYHLSLVFAGKNRMKKLNESYRGKDYLPNVLSFPLTKNEGEIFISLEEAKRQAPSFSMPYEKFVSFLFIHGLLHLKGMKHSSRMENEEKRILTFFGF